MVDGIIKLLFVGSDEDLSENSGDGSNSIHLPINVGNPNKLSVLEIARVVLNLAEGRSKVEFKLEVVDSPRVRRPDIT